jgi:hypothetical protein
MPHLVEIGHPAGLNKPKIITEDVSGLKSSSNINSAAGAQTNGVSAVPSSKLTGWREDLTEDDYAVLALRNLLFDMCNQNGVAMEARQSVWPRSGWPYGSIRCVIIPQTRSGSIEIASSFLTVSCSWAMITISYGIGWLIIDL